ncbi:MAG: T9SS type A sorting domain-containing protein, partial [Bacteroidota bacterium]
PAPAPEAIQESEIGGTTPGTDSDQVAVNGVARLGGTLRVTLTDGFVPQEGDRFLILPASGGAVGDFDAVELPATSPAGYVQATTAGVIYGLGTPIDSETGPLAPEFLTLHAPRPNPARGRATVAFDLPLAQHVRLAIYDALGREVVSLVDARRSAGTHTATLDARGLPAGVYVVRLEAAGERFTRTVTLVR